MKIVLALGMSSPLSTIVVASSRSKRRSMKSSITCSSSFSGIWPWADGERGLGHDLPQPPGDDLDVLDAVVDEEDLPAAVQLAQHGVADQLGVEAGDAGLDGQAVLGRRLQVRDVAQAQQAHVQRPRDGRGRHRQHVDDLPQRLQPLLHLDAEPLLLVDDHQPQVVEPHVGLRQPVRADDDVDRAFGQPAR